MALAHRMPMLLAYILSVNFVRQKTYRLKTGTFIYENTCLLYGFIYCYILFLLNMGQHKKLEQNRYIADGILKRISLTSVMLEIKFIGACMIHRAWINKDTIKIKIHH